MKKLGFLLIGLLVLTLAGCSSENADQPRAQNDAAPPATSGATSTVDRTALSDPNMVLLPSGVRYLDLKVGTGEEIVHGTYVQWDYSVFIADPTGLIKTTGLASSVDRPEEIYRGQAGVTGLTGLTEGVLGMRVGGIRRIHVPWELGWGEAGPMPRQNLIFEIQDLKIISRQEADEWQLKEFTRRQYIEQGVQRRQDSLSQDSISRAAAHGQ